MLDDVFGGVIPTIQKALDVRVKRHKMIASNLANLETPGYKAIDIDFQATMRNASANINRQNNALADGDITLLRTDLGHFNDSGDSGFAEELALKPDGAKTITNDDNNVTLEKEIGKLAENSSQYEIQANLLRQKFKMINLVITKSEK